MPHEFHPYEPRPRTRPLAAAERAAQLNARWSGRAAEALLAAALDAPEVGRIALVSSFGAESVVLLHMVAQIRPALPVLFIDTLMLFEETLQYQRRLAAELGLHDIRVIRPDPAALFARDVDGILHQADPDGCCALRKTEPLARALAPFDAWITGRKRYQGQTRAALPAFEAEEDSTDAAALGRTGGRIKINPLAAWTRADIAAYIERHALPRHPLIARGYASIGCAPCTTPVSPGEDPRAGRWRGRAKTECGIHFINGRPVRPGPPGSEKENAAADARPAAAAEALPPLHNAPPGVGGAANDSRKGKAA